MKGWVGLVGWLVADGLPTLVVTHQLQVERRTGKVRRPETDVLPLCHATNQIWDTVISKTVVVMVYVVFCLGNWVIWLYFAFAYSLVFINQFKNCYIATLVYYLQINVYVRRWVTGGVFINVYETRHLSVHSEGRVLITDWCNHGILLLISELQLQRVLVVTDSQVKPTRLYYDELRSQLCVAHDTSCRHPAVKMTICPSTASQFSVYINAA